MPNHLCLHCFLRFSFSINECGRLLLVYSAGMFSNNEVTPTLVSYIHMHDDTNAKKNGREKLDDSC